MNLYYEINDPELIEKYGHKYLIEYDAVINVVLNEHTFQPAARTRKMHPFKHCLERVWGEWGDYVEYLNFNHNDYVPNEKYPNTLPAVDLKEFVVVKLSAKEI
jgi:regulator of RNase E activity RraB